MNEAPTQTKAVAPKNRSLKELLGEESVKKRFHDIMGKKSAGFISSIISAHQANKALQDCDPQSILAAAAVAASLDLPINPSLGQAGLVPYNGQAQFQMQWKGYVQLAHRTSKYRRIHLAPVYEGQLVEYDEFTGTVKLDAELKKSDLIMGFYFFFELINGFRHEAYWSTTQCIAHGWKFSKSFGRGKGQWVEDALMPLRKDGLPDIKSFGGLVTYKSGTYGMCAKTVVKNELSKWGPLSTEMQDAVVKDQAVFGPDGEPQYVDTTAEPAKPVEMPKRTSQALPAPAAEPKKEKPIEPFLIERVTSSNKDGKITFKIWIGGQGYETGDEAPARAAKKWADDKTPIDWTADGVNLVEIYAVKE